jgi:exonuclease III
MTPKYVVSQLASPTLPENDIDLSLKLKVIKSYNDCKLRLILSNDIESNPGPNNQSTSNNNLSIVTYNVRGCKDFKKLKRLNHFFQTAAYKNSCVINLQETHLNENELQKLRYQWKYGLVQAPASNNSGGVAILYNKSYFDEIISEKSKYSGRLCSLTAKKNDEIFHFVNIYAPNDNKQMLLFLENLEEDLWDSFNEHPQQILVISGDLNLVFDPNLDSINRNQSISEAKVKDHLQQLMLRFNLIDSYRQLHNYGGFTWGRDNPIHIRSRLDYILVSKKIAHNITNSEVTVKPNESDHRMLVTELDICQVEFGPGIIRVNSELLNQPEIKSKIERKLKEVINDPSMQQNPHDRLDYVKMK